MITYELNLITVVVLTIVSYSLIDTIICSYLYNYLVDKDIQKRILDNINLTTNVGVEMLKTLKESFRTMSTMTNDLMIHASFISLGLFSIFEFKHLVNSSYIFFIIYLLSNVLSYPKRAYIKTIYDAVKVVNKK